MATKYWYVASNGNGTWNQNAGNWYNATNGGGGGAGVPSAVDTVIFDANSGSGNCTVAGTRTCYNLIMEGYTGLISGSPTSLIQISGNTVSLSSSGTFDVVNNPHLQFVGSGITANLTSNGQSVGDITLSAGVGGLNLIDDLVCLNNQFLTINGGTFNANNKNVTIGSMITNSGTSKTITMGSGTWTLAAAGSPLSPQYSWQLIDESNTTLNINTAKIRLIKTWGSCGLGTAINSTDTSIVVRGTIPSQWPTAGGILLIDDEQISYSSISGNTLTVSARGINGTAATSHPVGVAVSNITNPSTTLTADITTPTSTNSINVADNSLFGPDGLVLIDNEIIGYTAKSGTTLLIGITRGYYQSSYVSSGGWANSAATYGATHATGAKVIPIESRYFYDGAKTYPRITSYSIGNNVNTWFWGNGNALSGGGIANIIMENTNVNESTNTDQTVVIGSISGFDGFNVAKSNDKDFFNIFGI